MTDVIAVIGATGATGREVLQVLAARGWAPTGCGHWKPRCSGAKR
ncbi:hypothetical protein ACFQ4K_11705 [Tistrella bauzanensis]